MAPLHKLTEHYRPRAKLVWTKESLEAFDKIKAAINACPKLFDMDAVSPIHLYTDASDIGVVAYLCQKRADGKDDALHLCRQRSIELSATGMCQKEKPMR